MVPKGLSWNNEGYDKNLIQDNPVNPNIKIGMQRVISK